MARITRPGVLYSGTIPDGQTVTTDEYVPFVGDRPVFYVNSDAEITAAVDRLHGSGDPPQAYEQTSVVVAAAAEERVHSAGPLRRSQLRLTNNSGGPAVVSVHVDEVHA